MKNYILFILLFCANTCWGSAIDSIKTPNDLTAFLQAIGRGKDEHLWDAQRFYKADFDQNGITDICIDARMASVIMDMGNGKYTEHILRGGDKVRANGLVYKNSLPFIQVNVTRFTPFGRSEDFDTLVVFRNGAFVEHISQPSNYNISNISLDYMHGFCFDCQSYLLTIDSTGRARFESTVLNEEQKRRDTIRGVQQLTPQAAEQITMLLNYMNFEKLAKSYHVNATCLSSNTLRIRYDGGKTKEIRDYGRSGTLCLQQLYKIFDELFHNDGWTKTITKGPTFKEEFGD